MGLDLSLCQSEFKDLGLRIPEHVRRTGVSASVDTGAQMCITGLKVASRLGPKRSDLLDFKMTVLAANNSSLKILGASFLTLSSGATSASHMVYFTSKLDEFFLSRSAIRDLGIIEEDFPRVGVLLDGRLCGASQHRRSSSAPPPLTRSGLQGQGSGILGNPDDGDEVFNQEAGSKEQEGADRVPTQDAQGRDLAPCECLRRTLPPEAPKVLPFLIKPENVGKIVGWLKDYYGSSTFNVCKHQPLPMMKGAEPLRIFIREDAEPVVVQTSKAIADFPSPTDITGIRSWFDLVEQVAFSFNKTTLMEPPAEAKVGFRMDRRDAVCL